jgi:hypothetical protein
MGNRGQGNLAVSEKSLRARVEPVGRPEAGRYRLSADILPQYLFNVVVLCEIYNTTPDPR